MGNKVYASISLKIISTLLVASALLFLQPQQASAASLPAQAIQRLCERQEILGSRLPRLLINPILCGSTTPQEPSLTFTATPSAIDEGESSMLAWSSSNTTSCTASNGWSGTKSLSGNESVSPDETTTYTLSCNGPGGTVSKSATVTVEDAPLPTPALTFSANPTSVLPNASSTLTWDSTNASSCIASGGWSGSKSLDGNQVVTPSATTTYTLACGNGNSTSTQSVTVNVTAQPQPTVMLFANPTAVTPGAGSATTTLTWNSANATTCEASGGAWNGTKPISGTEVLTPTTTTMYHIDCFGPGGVAGDDVVVTFTPGGPTTTPSLTLSANPTSVTPGAGSATSTLTWTTSNATFCLASNGWSGSRSTAGSEVVQPAATTTYTLDCSNAVGTTTASATVTFASTTAPQPTLTLTAEPTNVTPGAGSATSTLAWSSTNADLCTASNGWTGTKSLVGTEVVQPNATSTYALLCSGPGGEATASVTVNFVPAPVVPTGSLLITEVMYDLNTSTTSSQGVESANEWVELFNGTNADINLGGYLIGDASSTDPLPSVVLPAGKFAFITSSSTTASFWSIPGDAVIIVLSTNIGQNGFGNGGDTARLLDSASSTVDAVSWGTDTTAFSPSVPTFTANVGDSIGRISNTTDTNTASDWERKTDPSPGQ